MDNSPSYQEHRIDAQWPISTMRSTLRFEENDKPLRENEGNDDRSIYTAVQTPATAHPGPKRVNPSGHKRGLSIRGRESLISFDTDQTNVQFLGQQLESSTAGTSTVADQRAPEPLNPRLLTPVILDSAAAPRMIYNTAAAAYNPQPLLISPYSVAYFPVGSTIAVRTANLQKQQWSVAAHGVVIAHSFVDYFVGKRLFRYTVALETPMGVLTSNFAPFFGEVGHINASGQPVFPPITIDDIIKWSNVMNTVYARFPVNDQLEPDKMWQKALVLSRFDESPALVQVLEGDLKGVVFPTTDLLPYSKESRLAILRGGEEWKHMVALKELI